MKSKIRETSRVITSTKFIIFNERGMDITQNVHTGLVYMIWSHGRKDGRKDFWNEKEALEAFVEEGFFDALESKYFDEAGKPGEDVRPLLELTSGRRIAPTDPLYLSEMPDILACPKAVFPELTPMNIMGELLHDLFWLGYLNPEYITGTVYWGWFDADFKNAHLRDLIDEIDDHEEIGFYHMVA